MKPRCPQCGLKIRRPNHANGEDHNKRAATRSAAAFKKLEGK